MNIFFIILIILAILSLIYIVWSRNTDPSYGMPVYCCCEFGTQRDCKHGAFCSHLNWKLCEIHNIKYKRTHNCYGKCPWCWEIEGEKYKRSHYAGIKIT